MTRNEVTELIVLHKLRKQLTWPQLAAVIGMSKEWTTAALLGQMTLTAEQAAKIGKMLELPAEAIEQLQVVPYKGSLPTTVPTDPTDDTAGFVFRPRIYRFRILDCLLR